MVGARAFFRIGGLQFENMRELFFGHSGAGQDAPALGFGGGGDDHHAVDRFGAAFLEQQRDIEHHQRRAGVFDQECLALGSHCRMDDRFEPRQFLGIAEHQRTELLARDAACIGTPRKGSLDCRHQRAAGALHRAHLGIGIEYRHARRLEHRGDG